MMPPSKRPAVGQLAAYQPLGKDGRKVGPPRQGWLLRVWPADDRLPERWTIRWEYPPRGKPPDPTLPVDRFRVAKVYDSWLPGYGPQAATDTDTAQAAATPLPLPLVPSDQQSA